MIVTKFGGTSVGDAERVANAIDIVAERTVNAELLDARGLL